MYLSNQDELSNGQKDSTLQSLLERYPSQFVATTLNTEEEEHNEPSEFYNDVPFKTGNSSSIVNPISELREQSEFLENLNCDLQQMASQTSNVDEMQQIQSLNDYSLSFQNPNSGLCIYSNIKYLKRLKHEFHQQHLFQTLQIDVGIESQSFVTSRTSVKTNHPEKNDQSIPKKDTSITTPNENYSCSTTSSVARPSPERIESTLQMREKTFKNVNSSNSSSTYSDHLSTMQESLSVNVYSTTENMLNVTNNKIFHFDYSKKELKDMLKTATSDENLSAMEHYPVNLDNSSFTNNNPLSTVPEKPCAYVCLTAETISNVSNNKEVLPDIPIEKLREIMESVKICTSPAKKSVEKIQVQTERTEIDKLDSGSFFNENLEKSKSLSMSCLASSPSTNNKELRPLTATNDEHVSAMHHYPVPAVLVNSTKSPQKRKRIDNLNSYSFCNEKQETSKYLPIVCSALPLSTNDYGHTVQKNIDIQAECMLSASSVAVQERLRLEEIHAQNSAGNSFHIYTKKLKPTPLPENSNRNEDSGHSKNTELVQLKRSNYPNLNSCKSTLLKKITQNAYNKIPIQPPIIEKNPVDFALENTNSFMSSCCSNSINKSDVVSFPKTKYSDHSEQNISSAEKSGGKTSISMSNCSVASTSGLSKFQNSTNMNTSSSTLSNSRLASCKSIEMKLLCQRVIPPQDVLYYLLDWKPIWLQKQMKTGIHPDIYSGLNAAKYSYNNSRKYIDINFQKQSDKLWLMLYESWKKQPSSFNANFDFYKEHPCYFENSATVTKNDILNNQDVILLNNQDVILVTFTTTKFERQCLFGFAYNIIAHDNDISDLFIEFTFCTTEKMAVKLNSKIDVQKLCNIKDILEHFSPLKVMHSSLLDEVIRNPIKHKQHISVITIPSYCSSLQLNEVIHSVIATNSLFMLVSYPPDIDSCTILSSLIPDFLLKPSTVLVCLRNVERCFKLAKFMASKASDFILALEEDEIRDIPVELREFTLHTKATALCDISQDDALLKVLRESQTVLTDMSSAFLSCNRNIVWGSNLVCLIDEAHMCASSETFVPLSYNPCTVVLLGKTNKNLNPYRWSSYNTNSLFLRLLKENTVI